MPKASNKQEQNPSQRKRRVRKIEILEEPSVLSALWKYVKGHLLGKVIALFMLTLLVVLANIVIAGDDFDNFYMYLGIELTLLLLVLWLFYLLSARKNHEDEV